MKNKLFNDLTNDEIKSLTREEFYSYPIGDRKSCRECAYLSHGFYGRECSNEIAIRNRDTTKPNFARCSVWKLEMDITTYPIIYISNNGRMRKLNKRSNQ